MIDHLSAHSIRELNRETWRVIARRVRSGSGEDWSHHFTATDRIEFRRLLDKGEAFQCTGGPEGGRVLLAGLAPRRRG